MSSELAAAGVSAGGLRARWGALWRHPEFHRGAREMGPAAIGIGTWGLVTGVAMVKAGMAPWLALLMSLTVFAGSAQLATAPLIASGASIWVVWATALCLNLRFVVFSAQLRPYFAHLPWRLRLLYSYYSADLVYVMFTRRFPQPTARAGQREYFWGAVLPNAGAWHLMSVLGIFLGDRVPEAWGLGFAGSMALLAMTYSLLGERRTWLPTALAAGAAIATLALPLRLNMLVAIGAAVAMGAVIDHTRWPKR